MSDIKRCDKCGEIVNAQDCWRAVYELQDPKGEVFDEDVSDLCDDCKHKVNLKVMKAMNK